ncbi:MAG: TolC family protein [Thioalkalispiraceae bacterium]|jgi:outer membrane protein TolC
MSNYRIKIKFLIGAIILIGFPCSIAASEAKPKTLHKVIHQVLTNYPSIKIARLEIQRARQEFAKIESQLGWVVSTQTGVSRDVGIFNIPSERFDASASIGRTQQSGNRLEISGQYSYEDSETVAIPSLTNPSERTTLDLNYRIPFGKGEDNPEFSEGLVAAEAGLEATQAARIKEIDSLVQQTLQLYYDAANTYMRIRDANKAIERSERLLAFVKKNKRLGLAERKDLLNVEALLSAKIADRDNLLIIWSRQRSELNRLTGAESATDFIPEIAIDSDLPDSNILLQRVYASSPDIILQKAQLKSVLSVGTRNTSGDTATGSVDDTEWAGGARLEYQFSADQRGFDAELYQSMLEKQTIETELEKIKADLNYNVIGILEQIERNGVSAKSSKQRLLIEKEKVEEAIERYKLGRADTSELIDNENTYFTSSLLYETRKIELARKHAELDLLLGILWDRQTLLSGYSSD